MSLPKEVDDKYQSQLLILFDAIRRREGKKIFDLLSRTPELLDLADNNVGRTPLIMAAAEGDLDVGKFLVFAGADTTKQDKIGGRSALMWAAWGGHANFVLILVDPSIVNGEINLDCVDLYDGMTALMYAAAAGNLKVLQVLLDAGAAKEVRTQKHGYTALLLATKARSLAVVAALIEAGASCDAMDAKEKRTAVVWAAMQGDVHMVMLLVQTGADLALVDKWGFGVLHYSVRDRHWAITSFLLSTRPRGLHLDTPCSRGMSPLHMACLQSGCEREVKALALLGADPWKRGAMGQTPLELIAIANGSNRERAGELTAALISAWLRHIFVIVSISQSSGNNIFKRIRCVNKDVWKYLIAFI